MDNVLGSIKVNESRAECNKLSCHLRQLGVSLWSRPNKRVNCPPSLDPVPMAQFGRGHALFPTAVNYPRLYLRARFLSAVPVRSFSEFLLTENCPLDPADRRTPAEERNTYRYSVENLPLTPQINITRVISLRSISTPFNIASSFNADLNDQVANKVGFE